MKTMYIQPIISVTPVSPLSILMASGGRSVSTNTDVHGGENSGDVRDAF